MKHQIYNMDACFYNSLGVYSFEAQSEMLQELGYDATYLSLWTPQAFLDLEKLKDVKSKYGLDVAAVYIALDLSLGVNHPENQRYLQVLETLEGCDTIELTVRTSSPGIRPSNPAGDEVFIAWLKEALEIASRRNITILLYSHYSFWLEKTEDSLRICEKVNHPNLGIVFCSPHWYALGGGDLDATIASIFPYMKHVNMAGIRPNKGYVEPLDEGDFDNFVVLGALERAGYDGPIGFEGWGWGSDIYHKLERSLKAIRSMEERIEKHPHWAILK